jgi:acetyltransferase
VGAKRDPVFGMVLLVGLGGTAAELLQDRALELPPLSERLARRMLESLRSWPLLQGYRGKPAINVERLIEVLMRLSQLIADNPAIVELDINPLLATPDDCLALDARMVLDHQAWTHPPKPYSHLAIRPYPEELSKTIWIKDGDNVLLRPIKPEDEPLWHELLRNCSQDTIHRRFRYMFKATTHEMATRFCFIDYDRELAIVAERIVGGERKLLGVGRLIANTDHTQAEFAVLVADPWQNLGLGSHLIDYCLEICRGWNVEKVVAETAADNHRMIAMFQHRGFTTTFVPPDTVAVTKQLD